MIHQLRIHEIFAAWRAFMGDQAWIAVKRQTTAQHGDLVGAIEDRTLRRTDYSPAMWGEIGGSGVACILRVAWQTDSPQVGAETRGGE